jgi:hypothetical protein
MILATTTVDDVGRFLKVFSTSVADRYITRYGPSLRRRPALT